MSVNFSNLWNHTNLNNPSVTGTPEKTAAETENIPKTPTAAEVREMPVGQTFSGEIVEIDGKEVRIMLDNDTYIQAKLERELNVSLGQSLIFEVKSNTGGNLALTPLFANLSQNPNIEKALNMANLPLNEKTQAMVASMMEEGMPIHKDALQAMYRQINSFPQSNVTALVEMTKLNLALTPENLEQFTNYKNFEHQLTEGIGEILEELPGTVLDMVKAGNLQDASKFLEDIIKLFTKEELPENGDMQQGHTGTQGLSPSESMQAGQETVQDVKQQVNLKEAEMAGIKSEVKNAADAKIIFSDIPKAQTEEAAAKRSGAPETMLGEAQKDMSASDTAANSAMKRLLPLLEQAGVPEKLLQEVREGRAQLPQLLRAVAAAFTENSAVKPEVFEQLLSSGGFKSLLKTQGEKQLLLKPEQIGQEKKVDEYYQRLNELVNKLSQSAENSLKDSQPLMKSVTNLQNNVDFMNQLNQTFTYIQLPLKMNQNQANGDLYVFTNKKNLAKKDGNLSAFLHLDMQSLGAVDVYVTMKMEKLSTKFYLEREELMDFMEENIHFLNERLENKGYSVNSQVLKREKDVNVMEEMLNKESNIPLLSKYSFDVRA